MEKWGFTVFIVSLLHEYWSIASAIEVSCIHHTSETLSGSQEHLGEGRNGYLPLKPQCMLVKDRRKKQIEVVYATGRGSYGAVRWRKITRACDYTCHQGKIPKFLFRQGPFLTAYIVVSNTDHIRGYYVWGTYASVRVLAGWIYIDVGMEGGVWIRLKVWFQPFMVISPNASWIRWYIPASRCIWGCTWPRYGINCLDFLCKPVTVPAVVLLCIFVYTNALCWYCMHGQVNPFWVSPLVKLGQTAHGQQGSNYMYGSARMIKVELNNLQWNFWEIRRTRCYMYILSLMWPTNTCIKRVSRRTLRRLST